MADSLNRIPPVPIEPDELLDNNDDDLDEHMARLDSVNRTIDKTLKPSSNLPCYCILLLIVLLIMLLIVLLLY